MKRRTLPLLLCVALLAVLLSAPACAAPPPRPASGYVADVAGVLQAATVSRINTKNDTLADATGAAIAVVTVDFLDGRDIDDYATDLFNRWGIGDAAEDNGLLVLLAVGEEDYYLLQGSGLQKALPTATLSQYAWDYLEEDFAAGNYDAGVNKLFDALYGWFETNYAGQLSGGGQTVSAPPAQTAADTMARAAVWLTVILVVVTLLVLVAVFAGRSSRRTAYYAPPVYRPRRSFRLFGRPRAPRPPRPPRAPRPPRFDGGFGSSFGGTTHRPSGGFGGGTAHRSSGSFGGSRPSSGGSHRSGFGGGSSRGGGAGRRH